MSFLEIRQLKKHYDSLDLDISLDIEKGSFTTILGQSGSGKSTLLRLIAGLDKSDSALSSIVLDDKDITHLPTNKRNLGMVSQDGSLFMNMKVIDNVAYGLYCNGYSRKQSRIEALEFMKIFSIDHLAKHYPENLSGGEKQRVALARTLIVKPKLILFDEPLSALDAPLRKSLGNEIKSMQKKLNFTAIMVTHDIAEAKYLSDKIVFIRKGKITFTGTPQEFSENLYF